MFYCHHDVHAFWIVKMALKMERAFSMGYPFSLQMLFFIFIHSSCQGFPIISMWIPHHHKFLWIIDQTGGLLDLQCVSTQVCMSSVPKCEPKKSTFALPGLPDWHQEVNDFCQVMITHNHEDIWQNQTWQKFFLLRYLTHSVFLLRSACQFILIVSFHSFEMVCQSSHFTTCYHTKTKLSH